jgi:hypothetical protein
MQQHWEHSARPEALKGLRSHTLTQFERQHELGDLSNMPPTRDPDSVRRTPLKLYQNFWGETKYATEMARDEEAKPSKRSVRAIDQLYQNYYLTSFVIYPGESARREKPENSLHLDLPRRFQPGNLCSVSWQC